MNMKENRLPKPFRKLSNIEILCNHRIFGRPNFTIARVETLSFFSVSEGVLGLKNLARMVTRVNLSTCFICAFNSLTFYKSSQSFSNYFGLPDLLSYIFQFF